MEPIKDRLTPIDDDDDDDFEDDNQRGGDWDPPERIYDIETMLPNKVNICVHRGLKLV